MRLASRNQLQYRRCMPSDKTLKLILLFIAVMVFVYLLGGPIGDNDYGRG